MRAILTRASLVGILLAATLPATETPGEAAVSAAPALQLFQRIDLHAHGLAAGFITLGDLNGDGRVELLLSHVGAKSTHVGLTACDLTGRILWQVGAPRKAGRGAGGGEPPCRGYCLVHDLDGDGRAEVVVELTRDGESRVAVLDGATGEERRSIPWPLGAKDGGSRPAPSLVVAHFDGADAPPSVVLKYEASSSSPARAVALSPTLAERWRLELRPNAMGHHVTVVDLDGDGREEVVLGETAVDGAGKLVFAVDLGWHADMTAAFRAADGAMRVLVSIDKRSACCLDPTGTTIWQLPASEVSHGQAVWAGRFLPDRPGTQAVILKDGHLGVFGTYDAGTGERLAGFEHRSGLMRPGGRRNYPDMPVMVRWPKGDRDLLWVPADRALVDGRGAVIADLGPLDDQVVEDLQPGRSKRHMPVQAIAANLYDDERDDLVLYAPVGGRAVIHIVGAADKAGIPRPYRHEAFVYNRKSYF